jgi:hypothetical protein
MTGHRFLALAGDIFWISTECSGPLQKLKGFGPGTALILDGAPTLRRQAAQMFEDDVSPVLVAQRQRVGTKFGVSVAAALDGAGRAAVGASG